MTQTQRMKMEMKAEPRRALKDSLTTVKNDKRSESSLLGVKNPPELPSRRTLAFIPATAGSPALTS